MRVYTVHLRRVGPDEDLVLVREGFNVFAFFLTVLWALANRLWVFAAAMFAVQVALSGLGVVVGLHPVGQFALSMGVSLIVGYLANDMRRRDLSAKGYANMGVVAAADEDTATQRFFDDHPLIGRAMVNA